MEQVRISTFIRDVSGFYIKTCALVLLQNKVKKLMNVNILLAHRRKSRYILFFKQETDIHMETN